MMKKSIVLVITLWVGLSGSVFGAGFAGGEITWRCAPNGNYRFTLTLYRDCAGQPFPNQQELVTNVPGMSTIALHRVSAHDISLECSCPPMNQVDCQSVGGTGVFNSGAVQKLVYNSDSLFPHGVSLTGVPPATGWYFAFSGCCRAPSTNIPNSDTKEFFLRSWMYPYQQTAVDNCFDSSPEFLERPAGVLCTGLDNIWSPMAKDVDGDSLVYSWASPLQNSISDVITNYATGYSYQSPLPGPAVDPVSVAAVLNPQSGLIEFNTGISGAFLTVIKVSSYRNGELIAEVFREVQFLLKSCGLNTPPVHNPVFQNPQGQYTLRTCTIPAGEMLSFAISVTNFQYCQTSSGPPVPQTIAFNMTGAQLAAPMNPGGCLNPPCVTLTPAPTPTSNITGTFGAQTTFQWQTTCDHIAQTSTGTADYSPHHFLLKAYDNACSIPSLRYYPITVVIDNNTTVPAPPILCVSRLENNDLRITWEKVTQEFPSFTGYYISRGSSPTGPFTPFDTVPNINQNTLVIPASSVGSGQHYFQVTMNKRICGYELATPEPAASNIHLNASLVAGQPGLVDLQWNTLFQHSLPGIIQRYRVYRGDWAGIWQHVGTTMVNHFTDTLIFQNQTVQYRVEAELQILNTHEIICSSRSNTVSMLLTGISEAEQPKRMIKVYPNPAQNQLTLLPYLAGGMATVKLYTYSGAIVLQREVLLQPGSPSTLELTGITDGLYLLHLETDKGSVTEKIQVIR